MSLELNPFRKTFKFVHHRGDFFKWFISLIMHIYEDLVCNNMTELSLLDYLLVLPGLVKLAYDLYHIPKGVWPSDTYTTLRNIAEYAIIVLKGAAAVILTLALGPLLPLAYGCACLYGSWLQKKAIEVEILPVDQQTEPIMGPSYFLDNRCIRAQVLFDRCYPTRVQLKNYQDHRRLLARNMHGYRLKPVQTIDNNGTITRETILGLYPLRDTDSNNDDAIVEYNASPIFFIVITRENREAILAMKKINAFYIDKCSADSLNGYLENVTTENITLPSAPAQTPLKNLIQKPLTLIYGTYGILRSVQKSKQPALKPSIDHVLPGIFERAGLLEPTDKTVNRQKVLATTGKWLKSRHFAKPIPPAVAPFPYRCT